MLIRFYNELFIMSAVTGGLYLILKIFNIATIRYLKASWHYYIYIVVYTFLFLPYHKLFSTNNFSPKLKTSMSLSSFIYNMKSESTDSHDLISIADIGGKGTIDNFIKIDITFLPYLLIAGSLIFIIVILIQNIKIHHHIFSACRLSDDLQIQNILFNVKQKMGISDNISLYISSYVSTPFIYGILRPRIVLPDIQFTTEELQYIFKHELTHWKRYDTRLKLLMLLINAVHWFNPLVYKMRFDIDNFCELSCDESIVGSMNNEERRRYCELMLTVLWKVANCNVRLFSAFSDKRKKFERRVDIIMRPQGLKAKKWVQMFAVTMTLLVILIGVVGAYAANEIEKNVNISPSSTINYIDKGVENDGADKKQEILREFTKEASDYIKLQLKGYEKSAEDIFLIDTKIVNYADKVMENSETVKNKEFLTEFTKKANGNYIKLQSKIYEKSVENISPMATRTINQTLDPNTEYLGTFDMPMAIDETIRVNFTFLPTSATIEVGILQPDGVIRYITKSGGNIDYTYKITQSRDHYLYLNNTSDNEVEINGYVVY